jgi:proliferating cell nuclear antigen
MDNSHVALVSVKFQAPAFKRYRCDRPIPLGVNLTSLTKVLKCAKDDDICTLKAADEGDVLNLVYEAKSESFGVFLFGGTEVFRLGSDRIAEYDMKLMDIDADTLNIPETEYDVRVTMQSSEFSRIVRDLSLLGESVRIEVSKEGVRFASDGEAANGSVLLRQTDGTHITGGTIKPEEAEGREAEDGGEEAEGSGGKKKKTKVKKEKGDDDNDVEMDEEEGEKEDDEGEFKPAEEEEGDGEEEQDKEDDEEGEEEESGSKKRKKKVRDLSTEISSRN